MTEKKKNLSEFAPFKFNSAQDLRIGIVVSEWNSHITDSLLKGAYDTLVEQGVSKENIEVHHVPGSYELPSGADMLFRATDVDALLSAIQLLRQDPFLQTPAENQLRSFSEASNLQ